MSELFPQWVKRSVQRRHLAGVASRDEFEDLVEAERPGEFLEFRGVRERALRQNRELVKFIGFDPKAKKCLDIGPGHGESLDVWHEMGAAECVFVENNPWCVQHNRLKGFARGWELDHLLSIQRLPKARFDFVWVYGSICCHKRYFQVLRKFGLVNWMLRVESIAAPGGTIVICPYWLCRDGRRLIESPTEHWMGRTFRTRGYEQLPFIEGHNIEPVYPVTWIKVVGK